jgi:hypothetical protein
MSSNLVPFGKYKGQPVEALAQDRQYVDWLTAQPWFRDRFASLYTVIINNFAEPSETPDHNALQVLFLDDAFCAQFMTVFKPRAELLRRFTDEVLRMRRSIVARRKDARSYGSSAGHYVAEANECEELLAAYDKPLEWKIQFDKVFEWDGVDVRLDVLIRTTIAMPWFYSYGPIRFDFVNLDDTAMTRAQIEIKPTVGDDYPAILRQMRGNHSNVLFTEKYTGVGATTEQFVKTFALSDKRVIFRRDVEAVPLADCALTGTLTLPPAK